VRVRVRVCLCVCACVCVYCYANLFMLQVITQAHLPYHTHSRPHHTPFGHTHLRPHHTHFGHIHLRTRHTHLRPGIFVQTCAKLLQSPYHHIFYNSSNGCASAATNEKVRFSTHYIGHHTLNVRSKTDKKRRPLNHLSLHPNPPMTQPTSDSTQIHP